MKWTFQGHGIYGAWVDVTKPYDDILREGIEIFIGRLVLEGNLPMNMDGDGDNDLYETDLSEGHINDIRFGGTLDETGE